jgi:hypothetical protein
MAQTNHGRGAMSRAKRASYRRKLHFDTTSTHKEDETHVDRELSSIGRVPGRPAHGVGNVLRYDLLQLLLNEGILITYIPQHGMASGHEGVDPLVEGVMEGLYVDELY